LAPLFYYFEVNHHVPFLLTVAGAAPPADLRFFGNFSAATPPLLLATYVSTNGNLPNRDTVPAVGSSRQWYGRMCTPATDASCSN